MSSTQEIMHLSYDRPARSSSWDSGALVEHLGVMIRQFIADVPDAKVKTNFKTDARGSLANPA
jgi:hypothetical protein